MPMLSWSGSNTRHGGWLTSGVLEDLCLLLYSEVRVNWNDSCINIISCLIGSQDESLIDLDELSYDPLVSSGLDLSTIQSLKYPVIKEMH